MKERSSDNFVDPEIDQLIKQYHKKPSKEVRDRLNTVLIHQRENTLERNKIQSPQRGKTDRSR